MTPAARNNRTWHHLHRGSYWSWKWHRGTGSSLASEACGVSEESLARRNSCGAIGVPRLGKKMGDSVSTGALQRPWNSPQHILPRWVRNAVPASGSSCSRTCEIRRWRAEHGAASSPRRGKSVHAAVARPAAPPPRLHVTFFQLILCVCQRHETCVTARRYLRSQGAVPSGPFRCVETYAVI